MVEPGLRATITVRSGLEGCHPVIRADSTEQNLCARARPFAKESE